MSELRCKRLMFLVETEKPLFLDIGADEWKGFKHLLLGSSSALWVTRGSLLEGKEPIYAMISGIACAIHTENIACRFTIVDLDRDKNYLQEDFRNLIKLEAESKNQVPGQASEYWSNKGVLHVGHLDSYEQLNEAARLKAEAQTTVELAPLPNVQHLPLQLAAINTSNLNNFYFEEDTTLREPLEDDFIEINVKAANIRRDVMLPRVRLSTAELNLCRVSSPHLSCKKQTYLVLDVQVSFEKLVQPSLDSCLLTRFSVRPWLH